MAKLSELIPVLAEAMGKEEATVAVHARHLRAARMISTAGRGPGGAEMTAKDCTNLLVSLMISQQAKDAPLYVERANCVVCFTRNIDGSMPKGIVPECRKDNWNYRFVEDLSSIISAASKGGFDEYTGYRSNDCKYPDDENRKIIKIDVGLSFPYIRGTIDIIEITKGSIGGDDRAIFEASYLTVIDGGPVRVPGAGFIPSSNVMTTVVINENIIFALGRFLRGN